MNNYIHCLSFICFVSKKLAIVVEGNQKAHIFNSYYTEV